MIAQPPTGPLAPLPDPARAEQGGHGGRAVAHRPREGGAALGAGRGRQCGHGEVGARGWVREGECARVSEGGLRPAVRDEACAMRCTYAMCRMLLGAAHLTLLDF